MSVARRPATLLAAGIASVALAGCGQSSPSSSAASSRAVAGSTSSGPAELRAVYLAQFRAKVLTDAAGYSLYIFVSDHGRAVTCTDACALSWPPLTVPPGTRPKTGPGVEAGLVGALSVPGGADVVTYDGWPLYTYVADVDPGMALGEGINLNGGPWYLIRPDGSPLVPAGGNWGWWSE